MHKLKLLNNSGKLVKKKSSLSLSLFPLPSGNLLPPRLADYFGIYSLFLNNMFLHSFFPFFLMSSVHVITTVQCSSEMNHVVYCGLFPLPGQLFVSFSFAFLFDHFSMYVSLSQFLLIV